MMTNPQPLSRFRKRLWMAGLGLVLFVLTMLAAGLFIGPKDAKPEGRFFGNDFLGLYLAGVFAQQGRVIDCYTPDVQLELGRQIARDANIEINLIFGAWLYPPFVNSALEPLASMSYGPALWTWTMLGVGALAISAWLLVRMLPADVDWKTWGLVPLLIATSLPSFLTLQHGQNTFVSLLLLTMTVAAWRSGRSMLAGLACGLLFYKPQLGLIVALVLVLDRGWRAAAGLAITGCCLLGWTLLATPGALEVYLHRMPERVEFMQSHGYFPWARHATLAALFRRLIQGRYGGDIGTLAKTLSNLGSLAFGVGLLAAMWFTRAARRANDTITRDRLIAATIVCVPMLMPYYVDYDLLLLAVPAVLCAAEMLQVGANVSPWLRRAWVMLYLCTLIGTSVAGHSNFNINVVAVAAMAVMLIHRAARPRSVAQIDAEHVPASISLPPVSRAA